MDTNVVTREAENRIRGAKLRESFLASPHVRDACDELQREFEAIASAGEAVPDAYNFVVFMNRLANRRFSDYLAADRDVRAAKSLYTCRAEDRDDAAGDLTQVLVPAQRASEELLSDKAAKLWVHGDVARTPSSLHFQAEEVSFWYHEAGVPIGESVLPGLWLEPGEIVGEIERRNGKLGAALGSLDEVACHLEAARARARKTAQGCDQGYLQVKATVEAVCRLGGQSTAVAKYGPPSMRKLQRSKKRKPRVRVERDATDAGAESRPPREAPPRDDRQSDPQVDPRRIAVRRSDPSGGRRARVVQESDLQTEPRKIAFCKDEAALPDGWRGPGRREGAVTDGRRARDGRFSAVTGGTCEPCGSRLSVTGGVCAPRGSRSEVPDTVRSPENRGGALGEGVTARIRRFFARPLGR